MTEDRTPLPPPAQREHWRMENEIRAIRLGSYFRLIFGMIVAIVVAVVITHVTLRDNEVAACKRNNVLKKTLIHYVQSPGARAAIRRTLPPGGCGKAFPEPIPFVK
jgi:hypothetical protein